MRLGSLFDGIGGWQLAAIRAGINPVWSAEIEKFPLKVTKKHFPETKQLGDVRQINGGEIPEVEIICAGSPCQDFSIAGKRKGLKGNASSLFFEATRIIREMRKSSVGKYPRYFIWENVTGIFNSNSGLDFKRVLEELLETEIPMPEFKWAKAGMVEGRKCQLAWRTLDAQYWGLPQRRKRIFLVADFTGRRAAEILFEFSDVSRNIETDGAEKTENPVTDKGEFEKTKCYGLGRDFYNQGIKAKFNLSISENVQPPLMARGAGAVCTSQVIRRLTPLESERLMGLPDNWTLIEDKNCSDAARYKAVGNGMAQPIADWIIQKIVEETQNFGSGRKCGLEQQRGK